MSEAAPPYRQMTQRLLGCDEMHDPRRAVAAAVGFLEELAPVLANLVGPVGLRAMEGRALRVTRATHPVLTRVEVGNGADGVIAGLSALAREVEAEELAPAATDLVARLIELLVSLMGEPIALRMLRRVRPDLQMDDPDLQAGGPAAQMDDTNVSEGSGEVE